MAIALVSLVTTWDCLQPYVNLLYLPYNIQCHFIHSGVQNKTITLPLPACTMWVPILTLLLVQCDRMDKFMQHCLPACQQPSIKLSSSQTGRLKSHELFSLNLYFSLGLLTRWTTAFTLLVSLLYHRHGLWTAQVQLDIEHIPKGFFTLCGTIGGISAGQRNFGFSTDAAAFHERSPCSSLDCKLFSIAAPGRWADSRRGPALPYLRISFGELLCWCGLFPARLRIMARGVHHAIFSQRHKTAASRLSLLWTLNLAALAWTAIICGLRGHPKAQARTMGAGRDCPQANPKTHIHDPFLDHGWTDMPWTWFWDVD